LAKYSRQIHADTVVLLDSTHVEGKASGSSWIYVFPITETAAAVGSKVVANVVALGAMNALTGLVSPRSLREAVIQRVPERFRTLNERALQAGEELITQVCSQIAHRREEG
jgi:2-oxoglutarate ferredoxin oxidoreductase subunit gamma